MSAAREEVSLSGVVLDDGSSLNPGLSNLRGVNWRINLGILPSASSPIEDLRRASANSRRRYADLRRDLLVDPYVAKNRFEAANLAIDNPLSQNPDSTWGRFFRNAELEKTLDQDLSRLYPQRGSYFQTPACQAMLRRILLLWCLKYQQTNYRQGMHELLAPLLYVLHVDVQHLVRIRNLHRNHFNDRFDCVSQTENFLDVDKFPNSSCLFTNRALQNGAGVNLSVSVETVSNLDEVDPDVRTIILASDAYGAEGELGVLLSERFMEHDAYCMFDALMTGAGSMVAMADLFSTSPPIGSLMGLPPVTEASLSLYHLLSFVDSSLYYHLVDLGVEPQYFALRWLRVLFGREFLLDDLLIIWDAMLESPNDPLEFNEEDDFQFGIARSYCGRFILAFAVSMLLQLRSSLLGAENATSCLQRLLNFPRNVDVKGLVEKARSLQVLAFDTSISLPSSPSFYRSRSSNGRAHSMSSPLRVSGSLSPGTLVGLIPESYWERKWKISVLQRSDIQKYDASNLSPDDRLTETQTAEPCANNLNNGKENPREPIKRRSLDLEDNDPQRVSKIGGPGPDLDVKKCFESQIKENNKDFAFLVVDNCLSGLPVSGDNSPIFAATASLGQDAENKSSEKSSTAVLPDKIGDTDPSAVEEESHASIRLHQPPNFNFTKVPERENDTKPDAPTTSNLVIQKPPPFKDRKLFTKFHWLWKLGRINDEGKAAKGDDAEPTKSTKTQHHPGSSSAERCPTSSLPRSGKDDTEKNLRATLRSLGHSMAEKIQVIESALQHERSHIGPMDVPENSLRMEGQVTAMAAVQKLKKIGNILSEM
ncbi:unnamed protein product [Victoria cruziana]